MTQVIEELGEKEWKLVEDFFEQKFDKVPDVQAMLFLIGINEYGHLPSRKFSKEQKQDLIHVAVCTLLEPYEYYMLEGYDDEGWPHFLPLKPMTVNTLDGQETLLKKAIHNYILNQQ